MKTIQLYKTITLLIVPQIFGIQSYGQLQVQFKECLTCDSISDESNSTFYYGNAEEYQTIRIASDYGPRRLNTDPYDWHGGVDYNSQRAGEGGDRDRGDLILAIEGGTVQWSVSGQYKRIYIDGINHDFGYGHLFRSGTTFPMRSGGCVLKHMLPPNNTKLAMIRPDGTAIGQEAGKVLNGTDTIDVNTTINAGEAVGPTGNSIGSGIVGVHLHLYSFPEGNFSISDDNTKDPLEFVEHDKPEYIIQILKENDTTPGIDLVYPGNNTGTIQVRPKLPNASNSATTYNTVYNVDSVKVLIKKNYELDINYAPILGPSKESLFSHGAKIGTVRYNIAENSAGDWSTTGMQPRAYSLNPWDDFYFADFATRVHKDDELGPSASTPPHKYADCPDHARYNDGKYLIKAQIVNVTDEVQEGPKDASGALAPIEITLDNFKPFVSKVKVMVGSDTIYQRQWNGKDNNLSQAGNGCDNNLSQAGNGCMELSGLSEKPTSDLNGTLLVEASGSEPLEFLKAVIPTISSDTITGVAADSSSMLWSFDFGTNLGLQDSSCHTVIFVGKDYKNNTLLDMKAMAGSDLSTACVKIPARQNAGNQSNTWCPTATNIGKDDVHEFCLKRCSSNLTGGGNTEEKSTGSCLNYTDISIVVTNTTVGENDGNIDLSIAGGTPPYTYKWLDTWGNMIASTEDLIAIFAGTYCYEVKDEECCSVSDCIVVENCGLQTSLTPTCICPGSYGTAAVTVSGGSGDFQYFWLNVDDGGFSSTQAAPHITEPGTYQVTVIDNTTGCEAVGWVDVGNCAFIADNFDVEVGNSCSGPNTGSISVEVPDGLGAAPYLFKWYRKTGSTKVFLGEQTSTDGTALLVGLAEGEYCFHVLSANGCELEKCGYKVLEYLPPSIGAAIVPESQPGNADGSISLMAAGGWQGELKYLWSNGADAQPINEHLAAGTYTVTVEFGDGQCSSAYSYEVHTCGQLGSAFNPFTVVYGETPTSPAYIDLTLTNLQGYAFNIEWSSDDHPDFHANTEDIYPEADGNYCYLISHPTCPIETQDCDEICDFSISFSTDPDPLAYECGQVQLTAIVSETSGPLVFAWSTGEDTKSIMAALGQAYCVTVTNGGECDAVACFAPAISPLSLAFSTVNATYGNSNGSAAVSVQGGVQPYSYSWENGAAAAAIGQLAPGEYCVTVTDYCGATASGCVAVQCEFGTNILSAEVVPVNCAADSKGRIALTITQPGLNITKYEWSNGSKLEDQTGLVAGEYCVTVTDVSGCTATGCYTVPGGNGGFPIDFNLDGGCLGGNNGTITAMPQNNNAPYTYNWSAWTESSFGGIPFSASTQTISGLEAGWYFVTVTNATGCSATDWTFIWEKPKFEVKATASPNPLCFDSDYAEGDVAIVAGTPPGLLVYTWYHSVSQTEIVTPNPHVEGLIPGAWAVSVTDGEGCIWPAGVLVEQYGEIIPNFVVCPAASTDWGTVTTNTPSGGVPPFQYSWASGGETGSWSSSGDNLVAVGTYTVTITDSKGCTATDGLDVWEVPSSLSDITISGTVTPAECTCCQSGGAIHLSIEGLSFSPYYLYRAYLDGLWFGEILGPFTETELDLYDLPVGTNLFQIATTQDSYPSGSPYCPGGLVFVFEVPTSDPVVIIVEDISSVPPLIDISVAGGQVPYSYQWSNGTTTQDISGMPPGTYAVTVTDAQGCTAISDFEICGQAPPILADNSGLPIPVVPCVSGGQDGKVLAPGISGGTPPFEYAWTGPNGFQSSEIDLTGLDTPGEYCLTISDACHADLEVCRSLVCDCEGIPFQVSTDDCTRADHGWVDVHHIGLYGEGDKNYFIHWNIAGLEELSEVHVDEDGQVDDVISGYNKRTVPTGETPVVCVRVVDPQTYCSSEEKCVGMWGEHDCFYIFERPRPDVSNDEQLLDILNTMFPAYGGNFINRCGQGDHCENEQEDYKTKRLKYAPYDCNNICRGGGIITCDGCAGIGPVSDGTRHMSVPVNYAGHFIEETDGDDKCYCVFPPGLIDDSDFDFLMERTVITKAQNNSWSPFTDFRYPLDPISAGIVAEVACDNCEEVEPDPDSGIPSVPNPPDGPDCEDFVDCGEADCLVTPNPEDCSYWVTCSDNPSIVLDEIPVELDIVWIDIGTDCPFEDLSYCELLLMYQCPINPCYPSFQEANLLPITEEGVPLWDISFHFGLSEGELDCGEDNFCDGEEIREMFDESQACPNNYPLMGDFGNVQSSTAGLADSLTTGPALDAEVFPNPFSNSLVVQVSSRLEGPGKVVVLNALGEKKAEMGVWIGQGLSSHRWTPDGSTPPGLYHVIVTMENGAQAVKKAVYAR